MAFTAAKSKALDRVRPVFRPERIPLGIEKPAVGPRICSREGGRGTKIRVCLFPDSSLVDHTDRFLPGVEHIRVNRGCPPAGPDGQLEIPVLAATGGQQQETP